MQNHRQQQIMELLHKNEYLRISHLAELCEVSQVTIRKDVEQLSQMGLLSKTHGEVALVNTATTPLKYRSTVNSGAKRMIAEAAADLIVDDDAIILDSGSTTMCIAREILNRAPITIFTNSVPISYELAQSNHYVSVCGGEILSRTLSLVGADSEQFFKKLHANKIFLGVTGVRDNFDLTTGLMREASIKRSMVSAADELILVADSTKFAHGSIFPFANFTQLNVIITTHPEPPLEIMREIERLNIRLIFAD